MSNIYRGYRTPSFSDIFTTFQQFDDFYTSCGIETTIRNSVTAEGSNTLLNLYYLLMSRYGNDHPSSTDIDRFKLQCMSIIFEYGPAWEKKLEVQKALRALTLDDMTHSMQVFNYADNPETSPETTEVDSVGFINRQTVSHQVRNKVDALSAYTDLLEADVTEAFLGKFNKLFIITSPELNRYYITEE